jgi:hypothetical protein
MSSDTDRAVCTRWVPIFECWNNVVNRLIKHCFSKNAFAFVFSNIINNLLTELTELVRGADSRMLVSPMVRSIYTRKKNSTNILRKAVDSEGFNYLKITSKTSTFRTKGLCLYFHLVESVTILSFLVLLSLPTLTQTIRVNIL